MQNSYKVQIEALLSKDKDEEAVSFLENYCKKNDDPNAKFDLALLLLNTFVYADAYLTSLEVLDEILDNNHKNVKAILLKAYIENVYLRQISDTTINKINKLIALNLKDIYSKQLYLFKAEYYKHKNKTAYIHNLELSIDTDSEASYNYLFLGRETKRKDLYDKAVDNIKKIYSEIEIENYNPIDFDNFINEQLRGVNITQINYESLREEVAMFQS